MANHSVIEAKIRELEEAYQLAAQNHDRNLALMFNRELIHHLLRLSDAIRNTETDKRPNS